MQPQPSTVSIYMVPEHLPPSVSQFLTNSLDIPSHCIQECWAVFKDVIWDHPTVDQVKQAEKDAFRLHGKQCGLSEYSPDHHTTFCSNFPPAERTIYPDQHCCINPVCTCATKGLPLKKEQQQHAVIFMAADGAFPAWSIHLYCIGKWPCYLFSSLLTHILLE